MCEVKAHSKLRPVHYGKDTSPHGLGAARGRGAPDVCSHVQSCPWPHSPSPAPTDSPRQHPALHGCPCLSVRLRSHCVFSTFRDTDASIVLPWPAVVSAVTHRTGPQPGRKAAACAPGVGGCGLCPGCRGAAPWARV